MRPYRVQVHHLSLYKVRKAYLSQVELLALCPRFLHVRNQVKLIEWLATPYII